MKRLILMCAFGVAACESEAEAPPACPAALRPQVDALVGAVEALEAWEERDRAAVAASCAAIAADLTGEEPALSSPPTAEETQAACDAAKEALAEVTGLSMEVTSPGDCERNRDSELTCLAACGEASSCGASCSAKGVFDTVCMLPEVAVDGADAAVVATLEQNLPPLVALSAQLEDLLPSGVSSLLRGVDGADLLLSRQLERDGSCVDELGLVADVGVRAVKAMSRFSSLLLGGAVVPLPQ